VSEEIVCDWCGELCPAPPPEHMKRAARCPTHEPHFWRRLMINQAREILPLGQIARILDICADEPAVPTTITPPLSHNTSAGRPVAPDTAPPAIPYPQHRFHAGAAQHVNQFIHAESGLLDQLHHRWQRLPSPCTEAATACVSFRRIV
jgi:hypothetical protein